MDAYLIVDPDSRNITIPEVESAFGVYGDNNAERKYFKAPRIVGNGIDLTECYLYVNYISASTKIGQILCDVGDAPNGTATEDEIVFSWPITRNVLDKNVSGEIFFAVQAKTKTGDTVFTTRKAKGNCYESIEGTEAVAEEYADIILQLISRMDKVEENIGLEVDNYFKENPVVTSEYLTQTLQPIKDNVSSLKEDLANVAIGDIGELDNIDLSDKEATLQGYYMFNNGTFVPAENFAATNKIPVVEGQKFIITLERIWNNSGISEFSADGSFVGSPLGTEYVEKSEVIKNREYTVPSGVSYVSFSSLKDTRLIVMKKPYTAIDNIFAINKKVDGMNVTQLFSAMYDKYIPFEADFANDGYMMKNGIIAGKGENYRHAMIPVTAGEKYKISGRGYYNCTLYTFIGEHGTITFYPSDITGIIEANLIRFEAKENGTLYVNYSGDTDYAVEVLKLDGYKTDKNVLDNKVILFTGDSICQASIQNDDSSYTGNKYGWAEIIKENNSDTVIRNYGIGGTTFAVRSGRNDSIYERISTMKERFPKCDYIVIEGGVNDYYNRETEQIGEMSDNYDGEYNTSTFAGALEQIFYDVNKKWNGIKIGFIVTFKTSDVSEWDTYMALAKKICEKWSIPYIDLFNHGRLNFRIEQMKKDYSYLQGGLHPNVDGYRIITPMIENWLKSI